MGGNFAFTRLANLGLLLGTDGVTSEEMLPDYSSSHHSDNLQKKKT